MLSCYFGGGGGGYILRIYIEYVNLSPALWFSMLIGQ